MTSGGPQRVRRHVVLRFVAATTSPSDRIGLRRTVGGGGETSGRRRGRDGTAAAALSRLCVRDRYAHSLYCGIVHTTHRYNEELASSINS